MKYAARACVANHSACMSVVCCHTRIPLLIVEMMSLIVLVTCNLLSDVANGAGAQCEHSLGVSSLEASSKDISAAGDSLDTCGVLL